MAIDVIHTARAPNRSSAHPASGMVEAMASRYPVLTHWMVVSGDWKSRTRVLVAILVMVMSSCIISAPSITTAMSLAREGASGLAVSRSGWAICDISSSPVVNIYCTSGRIGGEGPCAAQPVMPFRSRPTT